jgi:hypothetical protein
MIKKSTNKKKELPVTAICLLADHAEMGNRYRGASIDISYEVSVHLGKWFQRRRFLDIDQSETRIDCDGHVC